MSSQSNPTNHTNTFAATPNQSDVIGQGLFPLSNPTDHTNTTDEGESSNRHTRAFVFITHVGLVHSFAFILVTYFYLSLSFYLGFFPNFLT